MCGRPDDLMQEVVGLCNKVLARPARPRDTLTRSPPWRASCRCKGCGRHLGRQTGRGGGPGPPPPFFLQDIELFASGCVCWRTTRAIIASGIAACGTAKYRQCRSRQRCAQVYRSAGSLQRGPVWLSPVGSARSSLGRRACRFLCRSMRSRPERMHDH